MLHKTYMLILCCMECSFAIEIHWKCKLNSTLKDFLECELKLLLFYNFLALNIDNYRKTVCLVRLWTSTKNEDKTQYPRQDNSIQLLGRLRKSGRENLILYKVHLMHSSQTSSLDERSTHKWIEVDSTRRKKFTMVTFFRAYIKQL